MLTGLQPGGLALPVEALDTSTTADLSVPETTADGAALIKPAPPLPAPTGTVVRVATEAQLQSAVNNLKSNTTILIAPGTYTLTSTLHIRNVTNVALRGETGNRDDVLLLGPGMSNPNYGRTPNGVWMGNAQNVLIANLTVGDVYFHPIILNAGTEAPHIYNVRLVNAGEQFLKSNPDGTGGGADYGIVEYSLFEFTTTARWYYTSGIDVFSADGWIIRNNTFRNMRAPADDKMVGPVIKMWRGSRNTITEGNVFLNCEYGIAYGLDPNRTDDHYGGMIRNNFFYRAAGLRGDVGIVLNHSADTQVLNNTVILNGTYANAIEYRFPAATNVQILYNLTDAAVRRRDNASGTVAGNVTTAQASWFVNPSIGDLHLTAAATAAIDQASPHASVTTDFDGQLRSTGGARPDVGADEFVQPVQTYSSSYDFGTGTSPLQAGWTRVTASTRYAASLGYGWIAGILEERDRGTGTDLTRDLNQTNDGTFAVDLANGTYQVTITLGDASWRHDQVGVFLEGVQVDEISTLAGQFSTTTYTLNVADGQLTLRLRDMGGQVPYATINGLEISGSASPDRQGAKVAETSVSGTVNAPIDRVVFTFSEAIQDGTFTPADARLLGPAGELMISAVNKLSSIRYEVVFAPQSTAGDYQLIVGPDIRDLAGNLMDQNGNGTNGESVADTYTAAFTVAPKSAALSFDFGTVTSPVQSGSTRVTSSTRYAASSGYGWIAGIIEERDRGIGTDLTRDLNQTNDGAFAVDLANGSYQVTVTLGDASWRHDRVGVFLEGAQVDEISTLAGQFSTTTYTVNVADGQLTLRLRDMGGEVPYATIVGLEIVPATAGAEQVFSHPNKLDSLLLL